MPPSDRSFTVDFTSGTSYAEARGSGLAAFSPWRRTSARRFGMEPGTSLAGDRVMTDAWLRIVLFALVLASFGGCERPSAGEGTRPVDAELTPPGVPVPTPPQPAPDEETTPRLGPASDAWLGFPQYPGARQLCAESVYGFSNGKPSGLTWRSFASREAAATIAAFYGASATADGSFEVSQPEGRSLSIHPIAAKYPSCAEKARSGEATVIVIAACAGCAR